MVNNSPSDFSREYDLKHMSPDDFLHLGANDVVYVKELRVENAKVFAIHAADGTPLSLVEDAENLYSTLLMHNLTEVSVH